MRPGRKRYRSPAVRFLLRANNARWLRRSETATVRGRPGRRGLPLNGGLPRGPSEIPRAPYSYFPGSDMTPQGALDSQGLGGKRVQLLVLNLGKNQAHPPQVIKR